MVVKLAQKLSKDGGVVGEGHKLAHKTGDEYRTKPKDKKLISEKTKKTKKTK